MKDLNEDISLPQPPPPGIWASRNPFWQKRAAPATAALLQIGQARRLPEIGFGCLARGACLRFHVAISAAAPGRNGIHQPIPLAITKAPCERQFARGHGIEICKPAIA